MLLSCTIEASLLHVSCLLDGCVPNDLQIKNPQETNPVQDFLSATSYKLLSCDSDDTMIPNLASLKSGVTFSIKNSEFKGLKIFSLAKPYREN